MGKLDTQPDADEIEQAPSRAHTVSEMDCVTKHEILPNEMVAADLDTVGDDRGAKLRKGATGASIFAAATGAWFFEQSPANEMVRADIAIGVFERTQNVAAVGGVVMASTFIIEMLPATLFALGLNRKHGLVNKFMQKRVNKKGNENHETNEKKHRNSRLASFGLANSIGACAVVGERHMRSSQPSFKEDMKNAVEATNYVVATSLGVGLLGSGGLLYAEQAEKTIDRLAASTEAPSADHILADLTLEYPGYASALDSTKFSLKQGFELATDWSLNQLQTLDLTKSADIFVKYGSDWRTWMVLFGGVTAVDLFVKGGAKIRKKFASYRKRETKTTVESPNI